MHRFALLLASIALLLPSTSSAQDAALTNAVPSTSSLTLEVTEDLGTHPDDGLMIAGATVFLLGVTMGVAVLMPLEVSNCYEPGSASSRDLPGDHGFATCERAPLSAIPFAHLLGGGWDSIIAGPILLVAEIVGLFTFIGGAAHHHPNPPAAPRSGDVTITGVRGAEVGLGLTLRL